jgi:hypothetical protein
LKRKTAREETKMQREDGMLHPCKLKYFTAKEVKPSGWLKAQLRNQADGLGGNLDKVWPDVRDSRWLGGGRDGWERVPYWLDGFIPLAWLLEDDDMKSRATRFIDAILSNQQPDGWIAPCKDEERGNYDVWAVFLICKVLTGYHDCTKDERIEPAVYNALRNLSQHIDRHTLSNWAAARWFECLIPLFWLYDRRPEEWMIDLSVKLKTEGFDYDALYRHWRFSQPNKTWTYLSHVVNIAMSLKAGALFSRLSGDDPGVMAERAYGLLMRDHSMACGHFTGDECLAGDSPVRGSELCSVVEAMYSYEWLFSLTGDPVWADRLETLAFNALPAAFSPDMWAHQYDQMSNQIQCTPVPEEYSPFATNSGQAHIFGLEPNFGCCTANFSQGWPKFALSSFFQTPDGIAIGAIIPGILTVNLGQKVTLKMITDHPFEDGYTLNVLTGGPVRFALSLRIPSSAVSARINEKDAEPGKNHIIDKIWHGEETLSVRFDFNFEYTKRANELFCVRRGPLIFSLPVKDEWKKREYEADGVKRVYPYCDYDVTPSSSWNYGFTGGEIILHRGRVGVQPFSPQGAPVYAETEMAPVEWKSAHGVCAETPVSNRVVGKSETIRFIPYGCTNLRMTEMPMVERFRRGDDAQ